MFIGAGLPLRADYFIRYWKRLYPVPPAYRRRYAPPPTESPDIPRIFKNAYRIPKDSYGISYRFLQNFLEIPVQERMETSSHRNPT